MGELNAGISCRRANGWEGKTSRSSKTSCLHNTTIQHCSGKDGGWKNRRTEDEGSNETESQTHRQTDKQLDRYREMDIGRDIDRYINRQSVRKTDRWTDTQI